MGKNINEHFINHHQNLELNLAKKDCKLVFDNELYAHIGSELVYDTIVVFWKSFQ